MFVQVTIINKLSIYLSTTVVTAQIHLKVLNVCVLSGCSKEEDVREGSPSISNMQSLELTSQH